MKKHPFRKTEKAKPLPKPNLPKYCYARGAKAWVRYKDESGTWVNKATPYKVTQLELLRRYVNALLSGVEMKIRRGAAGPNTILEYLIKWSKEREQRGVATAADERKRLEKYAMPEIGELQIDELRPRHIRDMIQKLRARSGDNAIAPRTIHHIFNTLHTMYESALTDEIVWGENPVKVKPGVLPKKVDADPEWRSQATFQKKEVLMLISDPLIPVERRVQYALKALAGMRHGEMAALCWRHIDRLAEPLWRLNIVQAWSTSKKTLKRTKTEETRAVPVHPVLQKILAAWRETHWLRVHGRKPGENDFVVPTRNGTCVDGGDAVEAFQRDLAALELRTRAGSSRNRNGHDLRSWYDTTAIEDGADSTLIRRTTHAPPKDVKGGYERFSWKAICREVAKLDLELDGEPLKLVTESLQAEIRARDRWRKEVTPLGLEPKSLVASRSPRQALLDERRRDARARTGEATQVTRNEGRYSGIPHSKTLAEMLDRAARAGDMPRVLEIAAELRGPSKD